MRRLNLIYTLFLLLLLGSCKQQEQPWEKEENQAEVSLVLSLPEEKGTRGNVSDYPKDPSRWSDEEKLADGRYFEYVTVLILKNNTLQAYEDLDVTNQASQAVIGFDKTFTTGTYTLMAIANYNNLADFSALLDDFKRGTRSYNELMTYKLQAGEDGVAPKTMQPLTLIQEINLHPGQNQISGEMLRTYSRIRIELRNQSATNDLVVNGISFSNNFAQKEAYIWPGQGYLPNSRVALNVASDDALTSFKQALTIPKMENVSVNSAVVFDGYILESEEVGNDDYTYSLDLDYGNEQATIPEYPLTNITSVRSNYNHTFLIQNVRSGLFVRDYYSYYVYQGGLTYDELKTNIGYGQSREYLWELEPYVGQDCYRIKNVSTGNYIGRVSNYSLVAPSSTPDEHYFKFYNYTSTSSDNNSIGIQMRYQDLGGLTCLNDYNSYFYGGDLNAEGNAFRLYCVGNSDSNIPSRKIYSIVLRTINKETARPEEVRNIKRNDFINTLVTVTYNEEIGKFEFEVENWTEGGGDITFN